jgi:hypothetical protein
MTKERAALAAHFEATIVQRFEIAQSVLRTPLT